MTTKLSPNFINYSVSHATLKPEHLVERFSDFLRGHAPEKMQAIAEEYYTVFTQRGTIRAKHVATHPTRFGVRKVYDFGKLDPEMISHLINVTFWNALNEIAPNGTVFEAHEGDGSDFGFWQYEDETGDE